MFELLSDVRTVPLDAEALRTVHHGMNKVRVSVGEHSSEPSEVYIVTGGSDGDLETYIIFYMLEPGIHLVYGYEQNPYPRVQEEQVLQEATNFVEEMGSILEEVPWATMTTDQRASWIEKEALYGEVLMDGLEDLEEIEDLQIVEAVEVEPDESPDTAEKDAEPEDGGAPLRLAEPEDLTPVKGPEKGPRAEGSGTGDLETPSEDPGLEPRRGIEAADQEDVVVAEGDFDEMLKQAFLRPEVVEKTRKKARSQSSPDGEEQPVTDGRVLEQEELATTDDAAPESGQSEKDLDIPVNAEDVSRTWGDPHEDVEDGEGPARAGSGRGGLDDEDARLRIIRFLSRF